MHHVFIARNTPNSDITREEWLAVSRNTPELTVDGATTPIASAYFTDGPKSGRVFWQNGCVLFGEPSEEQIKVAFKCAAALQAEVLGPQETPYTSLADWDKRTRKSRKQQAARTEQNRQADAKRRRKVFITLVTSASLGVVVYMIAKWMR